MQGKVILILYYRERPLKTGIFRVKINIYFKETVQYFSTNEFPIVSYDFGIFSIPRRKKYSSGILVTEMCIPDQN